MFYPLNYWGVEGGYCAQISYGQDWVDEGRQITMSVTVIPEVTNLEDQVV